MRNVMPDENVPSLDIDTIPTFNALEPLEGRRAFRVPVLHLEDYSLEHDEGVSPIVNISADGAGVSVHLPSPFTSNELVENCVLSLGKLRVDNLEGRVVHCSPVLEGTCWLVGLQWLNLQPQSADAICELLRPLRDALFEAAS
jgi:hypothetical protein